MFFLLLLIFGFFAFSCVSSQCFSWNLYFGLFAFFLIFLWENCHWICLGFSHRCLYHLSLVRALTWVKGEAPLPTLSRGADCGTHVHCFSAEPTWTLMPLATLIPLAESSRGPDCGTHVHCFSGDPTWTPRPLATLIPLPESGTGMLTTDYVAGFCTSRQAPALPDPPACRLACTEKFAGRLWIMFLSSASSASHVEFLLPSQIR